MRSLLLAVVELLQPRRAPIFIIGLMFLAACLFLSERLLGRAAGPWVAVAKEGLTIAGWVAMWRPMQIYPYDWLPLRRGRIYAKPGADAVGSCPEGQRLTSVLCLKGAALHFQDNHDVGDAKL